MDIFCTSGRMMLCDHCFVEYMSMAVQVLWDETDIIRADLMTESQQMSASSEAEKTHAQLRHVLGAISGHTVCHALAYRG